MRWKVKMRTDMRKSLADLDINLLGRVMGVEAWLKLFQERIQGETFF